MIPATRAAATFSVLPLHDLPEALFRVDNLTPQNAQPAADFATNNSLSLAMRDSRLAYQVELFVGGVKLPSEDILRLEATRRREGGHSWRLTVQMEQQPDGTLSSPLGRLLKKPCALLAGEPVTVSLSIVTDSGVVETPWITGGLEHRASEDLIANTQSVEGLGPESILDQTTADLVLPEGSGVTRAEAVIRVTNQADPAPFVGLVAPKRIFKRIQEEQVEARGLVSSILEPAGLTLNFDRFGVARGLALGKLRDSQILSLTAEDLLASTPPQVEGPGTDQPSKIVVTTSTQLVQDCGFRTTVETTTSFRLFTPPTASFRQLAGSGILTPVAVSPYNPTEPIATNRVITKRTFFCDTLVTVVREIYAFGPGPRVWRYRLGVDGGVTNYNSTGYLYADALATPLAGQELDPSHCYLWPRWKMHLIERTTETELYDFVDGRSFGRRQRTDGWRIAESRFKVRANTGTPFADFPYDIGKFYFANGQATTSSDNREGFVSPFVIDPYNRLNPNGLNLSEAAYSLDGEFKNEETTVESSFALTPGWRALYADGSISNLDTASFIEIANTTTTWQANGDSNHDRIEVRTDAITGETQLDEDEGLPGYLPVAKRISSVVPDPEEFPDGERASPKESQDNQFCLDITLPPGCSTGRIESLSAPLALDGDDLRTMAVTRAEMMLPPTIRIETLPDPRIAEDVILRIDWLPLGKSPIFVHPDEVTLSLSPSGASQSISGRVFYDE